MTTGVQLQVPQRIYLFVWELGDNLGHLTRLIPIARALSKLGHRVVFASRNTAYARDLLNRETFECISAPGMRESVVELPGTINFSEVLLASGFRRSSDLSALVASWLQIFRQLSPDMIIADHSPSALVAATIAKIPCCVVGTGFSLPPRTHPMPVLPPFMNYDDTRALRSDRRVINTVNEIFRTFKVDPIEQVHDIYSGSRCLILSFPELDYYRRSDATFCGPTYVSSGGTRFEWPDSAGMNVFVYFRGNHSGYHTLMTSLVNARCNVIACLPHIGYDIGFLNASKNKIVTRNVVNVEEALRDADLVICYGGHGLTIRALLAGVPVAVMPTYPEQYMTALCLEYCRYGWIIQPDGSSLNLDSLLANNSVDADRRYNARSFSRRYESFTPENALHSVLAHIGSIG